jgi:hypothetical protein
MERSPEENQIARFFDDAKGGAMSKRPPRQRAKPVRKHDLRHLYGNLPGKHRVAIAISEPGGLLSSDSATLEIGRRRNGTLAHPRAAPEWVPPERPTIIVAQSVRNDPLGQMYARHQIEYVCYIAGRGYQELSEIAAIGNYGSGDPSRPSSHANGTASGDALDRQRLAGMRLRKIDLAIRTDLGKTGLTITHAVLIARRTTSITGKTKREKQVFAYIFRSCLKLIAVQLGLATRTIRSPRASTHIEPTA